MANLAEFTINNTKNLLTELNILKSVVEKKSTIPILSFVRLSAKGESLMITGTDLDNSFVTWVPALVTNEGEFCLNLQELTDTVRKAKGSLFFGADETIREFNRGTVEAPQMENISEISVSLTSSGGAVKLTGANVEQFPELPEIKTQNIVGEFYENVLKELIGKSIFNATNEQSRFTLRAVAIEPGKVGARFIATDGHRLGYCETKDFTEAKAVNNKEYPGQSSAPGMHLLNLNAAKLLQKSIQGKTSIYSDDHHLFIVTGGRNRIITARKPTGQFPTYRMILPKTPEFSFEFHTSETLPVLETACLYASGENKAVVFQPYYNNFVVKSSGGEKSFTGKAACDFPQNSAPGMMVNGQFLIDACNAASGRTLTLAYKHNQYQFDITGESDLTRFRFTIMPLGLGKGVDTENFQAITPDEKVDLRLIPFYKQAATVEAAKPNKKAIVGDIQSLLSELKAIAGIDGLPEMFAEITGEIVENLTGKIKLLQ